MRLTAWLTAKAIVATGFVFAIVFGIRWRRVVHVFRKGDIGDAK